MERLYIASCHASLEWSQAKLFTEMGYTVAGAWDIGSKQRPKLRGVTDQNAKPTKDDLIILHQKDNFPEHAEKYLKQGHVVVAMAFGQGCERDHRQMAELTQKYKNCYVVAYSKKDYEIYKCYKARVEFIRFASWPLNYQQWLGDWNACLCMGNSIHRRGLACGWPILQHLREKKMYPIFVTGAETQALHYGLGEVPWGMLRHLLARARCLLSLGTIPAPYTMALMQGMMAGCPVVAFDNHCGIATEGFKNVDISSRIVEIEDALSHYLDGEPDYKKSEAIKEEALKTFHFMDKAREWQMLFDTIGVEKHATT